ncbi:hypothetical protein DVS28_a2303 [Euzebya pacifica]|uniref:Uncharacterized protein n=1 Tax=Euzebya pacifica TaxID=1608957 RepID=A0A346XXN8_9ACTN|nr:hypothetical protein DVS28_a2303 [Euzebya pacifica]
MPLPGGGPRRRESGRAGTHHHEVGLARSGGSGRWRCHGGPSWLEQGVCRSYTPGTGGRRT